ncbi:MAG: DUF1570 domain-containing protein, partial [Planctomycetes bacterium]|nr:DUF1570 domain-containing protein [Planctomycetota bacterium]
RPDRAGPGAGAGDDGEEVSASRDGPAPWETPGAGETAAGGGGEPAEGGGRTGPSTDEPAASGETVVEEPLDPRARREAQDRGVMGDAAGQVEWGAAHVLESRFYRIRSNVRPDQIRYYGALLDAYFLKYVRVFDVDADRVMRQRVAQVARKKCDIWIYGSHREFMEREDVPETYGGFYSPSFKRIVAYHGYDRPDWNTRNTLVHEGCHQFQDLALGNLWNAPVWLIEGYATFFESAWFDGERVHIGGVPHDRLEGVKASIEAGDSTPLEKLIRMPQWEFSGKQYGEAWSLIYMIVYYNEDARRRRRNQLLFSQLFFSARGGPITPDQVEALFGGREKMRAFEADWRRYVVELPFDHDPARDGGPPAGETGE